MTRGASAPARVPPSEHPAGFDDDDVTEQDVDADGLVDRVRPVPPVEPAGGAALTFADLPPVIVAHRLPDRRYDVDDDLTHAALRALCPDAPAPELSFTVDASPANDPSEVALRAKSLYLDAFCALAWGRSGDEVVAALRTGAASGAGASVVSPPLVEAMVIALGRARLPFALRPLEGGFPWTGPPGQGTPDAPATPDETTSATATDPACSATVAVNEQVRARAMHDATRPRSHSRNRRHAPQGAPAPTTTEITDTRRCVARPEGVWSLRFTSLRFGAGEDGVSGAMEVACAPAQGRAPWGAAPLPQPWVQGAFRTRTYGFEDARDWDGDGRAEAVVRTDFWEHEGARSSTLAVYTARDGAVTLYPPAAGYEGRIQALEDADGDGRMDLVLPTAWSFVDGCGMDGIAHDGPRLIAHALPDGTFSTRDDVARAYVTRACERLARPGDDFNERYDDRDIWRVVCARVWGASPDRIVSALRATHRGRPRFQPGQNDREVCYAFQTLASLALLVPVFTTPR